MTTMISMQYCVTHVPIQNVVGLLMCKANLFFKKWQFHTFHLFVNLFFCSKETRHIRSNQTLELFMEDVTNDFIIEIVRDDILRPFLYVI